MAAIAVGILWGRQTLGLGELSATLAEQTTADLERRQSQIDKDVAQLAAFTMRNGVGRIGYRSPAYSAADQSHWLEINWGEQRMVDQIILVPVIWRESELGLVADGFPVAWQIRLGTAGDEDGRIVATATEADGLLPRIAPVVLDIDPTQASWLRLEVSGLSQSVWNPAWYRLKLSEVLVFDQGENVALRAQVKVADPLESYPITTAPENVVDGFVPYEMDAATGRRSLAFIGDVVTDQDLAITLDLGKSQPIDSIHLHRVDMNDSIPQAVRFDFAIPRVIEIEGANQADFSDAVTLDRFEKTSIFEVGPVIKRRFQQADCRYVRLTAVDPFSRPESQMVANFGFSEVEIFSVGKNVSLGSAATASFEGHHNPDRSLASLTDGRNFYGDILSDREWLGQLALRHDLEAERPLVVAELGVRYARQKIALTRLRWLAVVLGGVVIITILVERIVRLRQMAEVKERLAADLHDELGANLHTIGLLTDLAEDARSTEELSELHTRIRSETERSGRAVRRCTDMLEAQAGYAELRTDIPRVARRILGELEHDYTITGGEYIDRIDSRVGYDLFLFYKECLVNISRHSQATSFETTVACDGRHLCLTVCDNGKGLPSANRVPTSLKRRAKILKAKICAQTSEAGGACISLTKAV